MRFGENGHDDIDLANFAALNKYHRSVFKKCSEKACLGNKPGT